MEEIEKTRFTLRTPFNKGNYADFVLISVISKVSFFFKLNPCVLFCSLKPRGCSKWEMDDCGRELIRRLLDQVKCCWFRLRFLGLGANDAS